MHYEEPTGLPEPDSDSAAHSRRVSEYIADRIEASGGSISFAEFMQHALYAPGLGYYTAGSVKFGEAGDFVTAPEISPVFGRVLARQCADVLDSIANAEILEFGAGSGKLAVDVLSKLEELGSLPGRYRILEVSADLQDRQRSLIESRLPGLTGLVEWITELPSSFDGVVFANEVLDAMPVERFQRTDNAILQQRVALESGSFRFTCEQAPDLLADVVLAIEQDLGRQLQPGYVSEVSLATGAWIADVGAMLGQGCIFLFDYGCSRREYFAEDRSAGWLRCHFRHRAHDNPLVLAGIQDITAWVDFSAVADAAVHSKLEIAGYLPQSMFLLGGGLEQELASFDVLAVEQQLALSGQIKTLTLPGEMGENVKCMALRRGATETPTAFRLGDRTHTL
jgi:SAM-dependent MidA family methyltransferase